MPSGETQGAVRVHLFAQAREAAGVSEVVLRLPAGATVESAARALAASYPALEPHLARCSFAVNERYAGRAERLEPGDELAVIPPIGGG